MPTCGSCVRLLASFRKTASPLFRFFIERHAIDPALVLDEVYPGALECVLDTDDGGDVALRQALHLLNAGNGREARF